MKQENQIFIKKIKPEITECRILQIEELPEDDEEQEKDDKIEE